MNKKILSVVLLFSTAIIWGFAFVAQVSGSTHIDSYTFNALRFLLGGISLIPVVAITELKARKHTTSVSGDLSKNKGDTKMLLLASAICGLLLFMASALQQTGAQITQSSGRSGFITSLYTVITPILYFLVFRKKVRFNVLVGAAATVVGLFMLCIKSGEGFSFGKGELLLILCSVFFAVHILMVDIFVKNINSLKLSMLQFIVCGLVNLAFAFIFDDINISSILAAKWSILYCGLLSVGVGYTLQVVAQRISDPNFAAIVLSTESVFSAVGGVLFGIDSIEPLGYVGCLIIFCGIVFSQLEFKSSSDRAEKIENIK